jgi:DNA-binding IclR family transcriptional regulator
MPEKTHRLLQNALEILDWVADSPEPTTSKKLREIFKFSKSTLYNLVYTLVNVGYLEKDALGRYTIGIRCFKTGNAFRVSNPFMVKAKEIVEELNMLSNETTHLAVLEGIDVVYIYKFDSTHAIRIYSQVGKKIPAHTTAIGKALLSGYSDDEIRRLYPEVKLPALTRNSITSVKVLIDQLREVRRTAIAYEQEESTPYVKCVAAPVMNSKEIPIAGISVALPVYREDEDVKKIIPLLLEAKHKLERLYVLYE